MIHLSPAMAQSAPKPVWSESSKKEVLSLLEASFANFVPLLLRGEKTPGDAEKMFLEYLRGGGLATNHDMLVPLKQHGVSMTRFESRPARSGQWEYFFYIDLQGHPSEPQVKAALADLQNLCAFYKVLGTYPLAD